MAVGGQETTEDMDGVHGDYICFLADFESSSLNVGEPIRTRSEI